MKEHNAIIVVRGGIVQSVYSNDASLGVTILDYDNVLPFTQEEKCIEALVSFVDKQNKKGNYDTEYVEVY